MQYRSAIAASLKGKGQLKFELLEAYLAILEHGSILAAAEVSRISQPSLSRKIQELEDSLGVLLLNRTSRGVSPTVFGLAFKRHAEQMLRDRQMALDEIRALRKGVYGHARIGMAPSFSGYLPGVIRSILEERSGVTFEVVEGTYDSLVHKTLKGEIDGAFTMLPPGESDELLAVKLLAEESIVIVADPGHPRFDIARLGASNLENESWILMNRPRSILTAFYHLASEHGATSPHIAIETSSLDFLKSVLKGSNFLTALPEGAVHAELKEGSLRALDLGRMPSVQTAFVHRHGVMPPLVTKIVHAIESARTFRVEASLC